MPKKKPAKTKVFSGILYSIFFLVPVVYSHLYISHDLVLYKLFFLLTPNLAPYMIGFERLKVIVFFILVGLAFLLSPKTIFEPYADEKLHKKDYWLTMLFVIVSTLAAFLAIDRHSAIYGTEEKAHGIIFYYALGLFSLMLRKNATKELIRGCLYAVAAGFVFIFCYAQLQAFGLDPNLASYDSRTPLTRVFSTFGNPNYLAGYLILLLPFVIHYKEITEKTRFWTVIAVYLLILQSGGLIAVYLSSSYLVVFLLNKRSPGFTKYMIGGLILLPLLVGWYLIGTSTIIELVYHFFLYPKGDIRDIYLEHLDIVTLPERIRGLLARPFFWSTALHALWDPIRFFIGYGPDQFIQVYETYRHPFLMHDILEHTDWIADRSHNFFIDIWIHSGFFGLIFIIYIFSRSMRSGQLVTRDVFLLFSIFFFFNIPTVSHYILIFLSMAVIGRDDYN